jgi:F-type H+-transporting ATPase subunit delta
MKIDGESLPSYLDQTPPSAVFYDVEARRVAHVYARALMSAAEKAGRSEEIVEELDSLLTDVFRPQPDFEHFLTNPTIGRDRKKHTLQQVFKDRASDLFLNFLIVLNEHDRLDILRSILIEAVLVLDELRKRRHVVVRSAAPLADDQRTRLLQQLRQVMQLEPKLLAIVDPDLIGGLTVRVGDWLYDASVRTRLNTIRNQLFASSSHEIQTRRDRFSSDQGN